MTSLYQQSISIIIVNFNGEHFLKDCLISVLRQDYPSFEVIIVDNASTDGSIEFLNENFPQTQYN
ncbi:MAG TPA: hypothetical protein DCQ28_08555 [Bacteroidetes bacterium]|nr:hypothetical protein [Bacteroidota bacterium]